MNQKSAFHVKRIIGIGISILYPYFNVSENYIVENGLSVLKVIESKRQCLMLRLVSFINHMIISCIYILSVCFL